MPRDIMDVITEYGMNERLDTELLGDPAFIGLQKKRDAETEAFDRLGLSREERFIVDRMVSAYTECAAYHSAAAYRYGMRDCAAILSGIELLKGTGAEAAK